MISARQLTKIRHRSNAVSLRRPFVRSQDYHAIASRRNDEEERRKERARLQSLPTVAAFHTSLPVEFKKSDPLGPSGLSIVLGLGALSAASFAASSAVRAVREWQDAQPEAPPTAEETNDGETNQEDSASSQQQQQQQKQEEAKSEGPRENVFAQWFDVGSKFYEGGFEDKMTKREAALILGVRESSSAQRIKEAHRKLLILNHPDTGGSTYLSGKLNEAKELLLKGKK